MPAGDGSLGPLALAAALAAAAGAVVPFIVTHLIALAVITVVTVAGTARDRPVDGTVLRRRDA
jgi:hypothetical protein